MRPLHAQQISLIEPLTDGETRITLDPPVVDQSFGFGLAVDGNRMLVGAPYPSQEPSGPGEAILYIQEAGIWTEAARLTGNDAVAGDDVGAEVAFLGDWILVGARDHDASGIDEGALYVFAPDGEEWIQVHKVLPPDIDAGDAFSGTIDVDAANSRVILGAHYWNAATGSDQGAAYIYRREGGNLVLEGTLTENVPANDYYASGAAILGDFAFVGAFRQTVGGFDYAGSVYVYRRSTEGAWSFVDRLMASDVGGPQFFGARLDAAVVDGVPTLLVGASFDKDGAGAGYVFTFDGDSWIESAKLTAGDAVSGDRLGFSVSLTPNEAVLGTFGASAVYRFAPESGNWIETEKITASDNAPIGYSVAASSTYVATGAPRRSAPDALRAGAAYVYGSAAAGPIAQDDAAAALSGEPVVIDVVANDSDPNGASLIITDVGEPLAGTARLLSDSGVATEIEYRSHEGFGGIDQFSYTISNGSQTASATVQVTVEPPSAVTVWPGDLDNNGVVEAADLFPLANCFSATGPSRDDPTDIAWAPYIGTPWSFQGTSAACRVDRTFTDPVFADAIGDGVINQNDLLPVGVHFGKVQDESTQLNTSFAEGSTAFRASSGGGGLVDAHVPEVAAGDTILIHVEAPSPTAGVTGVALGIALPTGLAEPARVSVSALEAETDNIRFIEMREASLDRAGDVAGTSYVEAAVARLHGKEIAPSDRIVISLVLVATESMSGAESDALGTISLQYIDASSAHGRRISLAGDAIQLSVAVVGSESSTATDRDKGSVGAHAFSLLPPYPNPFNPQTTLRYELPAEAEVALSVFDLRGRVVAKLVDEVQPAGRHEIIFQAAGLASGIYAVRIDARPLTRGSSSFKAARILHLLK